MERTAALLFGILAWAAVGGVAISAVHAWSDDNQVLAFVPIAAAVLVAWVIGEVVTAGVFASHEEDGDDAI